jgi:Mrp family chromosome partitioning ATPase
MVYSENPHKEEDRLLQESMSAVRRKLVVLSGKGGVGKSTVAANLAFALAAGGRTVGLLDVDIHGPSIPRLAGLTGAALETEGGRILPVRAADRLAVMSIGFLLASPEDAVIWRGPLKYGAIKQLLSEVAWGELDDLVIDCPPGTGDEPLSVAQLVGRPAGAVIVTTPQELAVADVRRCVSFCRKAELGIAGIVENMSGCVCPECGKEFPLFGAGGGERLAREMNVPFLGRIPLDGAIVECGDAGVPFFERAPAGASAKAFREIVTRIGGA